MYWFFRYFYNVISIKVKGILLLFTPEIFYLNIKSKGKHRRLSFFVVV